MTGCMESAQAAPGPPRIKARLIVGAEELATLHGKRLRESEWRTKTDIDRLPCAGPHTLRAVTRYAGVAPNLHTTYPIRVGKLRLQSGRARCGHPVPKRYGNRHATIRLRPRGSPEAIRVRLSGRRMWRGGPFKLRLRLPALVCAGRYSVRIRMDGPHEPLLIGYRVRVGNPDVHGGPGCTV